VKAEKISPAGLTTQYFDTTCWQTAAEAIPSFPARPNAKAAKAASARILSTTEFVGNGGVMSFLLWGLSPK
jgi:hypothetical protein